MDLDETEARNDCAGESQQQFNRPTVVAESVESCSFEKWETGSWRLRGFGNPEEGERQPLETATKQWIVKTDKTFCVL
jgi:hypothetical protein